MTEENLQEALKKFEALVREQSKNGASILVQKKINWTEDGWLTLE